MALGSQALVSATQSHTALPDRAGTEHGPACGWWPLLSSRRYGDKQLSAQIRAALWQERGSPCVNWALPRERSRGDLRMNEVS